MARLQAKVLNKLRLSRMTTLWWRKRISKPSSLLSRKINLRLIRCPRRNQILWNLKRILLRKRAMRRRKRKIGRGKWRRKWLRLRERGSNPSRSRRSQTK